MAKVSRKSVEQAKEVSRRTGQELIKLGKHYNETIRFMSKRIDDLEDIVNNYLYTHDGVDVYPRKLSHGKKEEAPSES